MPLTKVFPFSPKVLSSFPRSSVADKNTLKAWPEDILKFLRCNKNNKNIDFIFSGLCCDGTKNSVGPSKEGGKISPSLWFSLLAWAEPAQGRGRLGSKSPPFLGLETLGVSMLGCSAPASAAKLILQAARTSLPWGSRLRSVYSSCVVLICGFQEKVLEKRAAAWIQAKLANFGRSSFFWIPIAVTCLVFLF